MTFPSDRTMISLAALDNASEGKATADGRQYAEVKLTDDRISLWEIIPSELDRLEAEGWIDLIPPAADEPDDAARVSVTRKGKYAVERWIKMNRRRIPQLTQQYCGLPVG